VFHAMLIGRRIFQIRFLSRWVIPAQPDLSYSYTLGLQRALIVVSAFVASLIDIAQLPCR
jgi:hypothetical protein